MAKSVVQEFTKGLWDEIPPFRLVLGLCPTLAVTKTLENGIGMGVATTFVLVGSNVLVSARGRTSRVIRGKGHRGATLGLKSESENVPMTPVDLGERAAAIRAARPPTPRRPGRSPKSSSGWPARLI